MSLTNLKTIFKPKLTNEDFLSTSSSSESKNKKIILSVNNLSMIFKVRGTFKQALNNVNFDVYSGDFFGIIGESGSGKTTIGQNIVRLHNPTGGSIFLENQIISKKWLPIKIKRWMHKNVQMIFQDPISSMNPIKSVMNIVAEPLIINKILKQETITYLSKLIVSAPLFRFDFHKHNEKILIESLLAYHELEHKIYNEAISLLEKLSLIEFKSFEELVDYLVNFLNKTIEKKQKNLEKIYQLNKQQQEFIEQSFSKYNKKEFESIDLELDSVKKTIIDLDYSLKNSFEMKQIKSRLNEIDLIKNKEKKFIQQKFLYQNSGLIEGYIKLAHSSYKLNLQKFHLTKNSFKRLYFKYQMQMEKTKHYLLQKIFYYNGIIINSYALNKLWKKQLWLENYEIDKINKKIIDFVSKKYESKIMWILQLEKKFQKANIAEKTQIFKEIKAQEKKDGFFIFDLEVDTFIYNAKDYFEKSDKNKKELITKLSSWNNEKKELNIKYKKLMKVYFSDKEIKKEFYKEKEKFQIIKKEIQQQKKEKRKIDFQNLKIELTKFLEKKENALIFKKKNVLLAKKLKKIIFKLLKDKFKNEKQKHISIKTKMNFYSLYNSCFQTIKNNISANKTIHFEYRKAMFDFYQFKFLYSYIPKWFIFLPNFFIYYLFFFIRQNLLKNRVFDVLTKVGLKYEHAYRYPHEFSGGQRQRIAIARALITNPKLIVADEPISALDVSIQSQVVNIMKELSVKHNVCFLFIAHDLSMVNYACNRLIIMHNGNIVERGCVKSIFSNPIHPYTISLLKAVPELSRIHVNLASFEENHDYANDYGLLNQPSFFAIPGDMEHEVLATEEQFNLWTKNHYKIS